VKTNSSSPKFGALGLGAIFPRRAIPQAPLDDAGAGIPGGGAAVVVQPVAQVAPVTAQSAPIEPQTTQEPKAEPNADLIKRIRENRLKRQQKAQPQEAAAGLPKEIADKVKRYDEYVLKTTERLNKAAASLSPEEKSVFDLIPDLEARERFLNLLSSRASATPVQPVTAKAPRGAGSPPPSSTPVDINDIINTKGAAFAQKTYPAEYAAYADGFSQKKSSTSFANLKKK
jgi:hypothetical protein